LTATRAQWGLDREHPRRQRPGGAAKGRTARKKAPTCTTASAPSGEGEWRATRLNGAPRTMKVTI